MNLLIRDEADVIRENLEFHFERGVDHVIVTDNGSEDRTRDVPAEFERMGVATIIGEPEQNYAQGK
ncbi:MAG: glycosyltransferase family 2 protein [Breoghania sp.]|nr:glycosyltransferase family 2 protein [Breoghania sp.]